MFWKRLLRSRNKCSEAKQPEATSRLRKQLICVFDSANKSEVYTIDQLADQLHVNRVDDLAAALADLSKAQVVDQVFRVESPKNRGGIEDYSSLDAVPNVIHDWRQDEDIEVAPNMVRMLFRKHQENANRGERQQLQKIG